MEIKKFEKYEIDQEYEIGEEYAKFIISQFMDRESGGSTLESIYAEIVKGDDLDEVQEEIIRHEIIEYAKHIYDDAKKIRELQEIDADKYNL